MDSSKQSSLFDQCLDALDIYSYAVMRFYISPHGGGASKNIMVSELSYLNALASLKQFQRHHFTRDKETGSYFYLVKYLKAGPIDGSYGIGGPYDGIEVPI